MFIKMFIVMLIRWKDTYVILGIMYVVFLVIILWTERSVKIRWSGNDENFFGNSNRDKENIFLNSF